MTKEPKNNTTNGIYKSTISCYYFAQGSRLPFRIFSSNTWRNLAGLSTSPSLNNTSVNNSIAPTERRESPRISSRCDAELTASLSILDRDAAPHSETIIFFGQTKDLAAKGLGLILPSARIDERYCNEANRLKLSLHLPEGDVAMEISTVRCVPLNERDLGRGYLLGAKIIGFSSHREQFDRYLGSLASLPADL